MKIVSFESTCACMFNYWKSNPVIFFVDYIKFQRRIIQDYIIILAMFNSFVNIFVAPIQRNAFSTDVLEILYQVYFDYYCFIINILFL